MTKPKINKKNRKKMGKTQVGRSCYKFLKRHGKIESCDDFYNLYIKETGDTIAYTTLEHYFCSCNSSKYRTPPEKFINWCQEKLNKNDTDFAQHFTLGDEWLTIPVKNFITKHAKNGVLDPYAGDCSLMKPLIKLGITNFIGYDIDQKMLSENVSFNDSLNEIPNSGRLIVTNPPFMSKCTATRYGSMFSKYFENTKLTDIYLIALSKCLANHKNVVAIVPETFLLNGNFTERLSDIVIIEENIFGNTNCPVLVACFQETKNPPSKVKIHKNEKYLFTLSELRKLDKVPNKKTKIVFNEQIGNIGLRGIDGTKDTRIAFCTPDDLNYKKQMKVSSRLISLINVPAVKGKEAEFIEMCNKLLEQYRNETQDLLMAPFKGNNKLGQRRRRIDYKTARAIMENAIVKLKIQTDCYADMFGDE